MKLLVEVEVDPESSKCYRCRFWRWGVFKFFEKCRLFNEKTSGDRLPVCLAAEKKAKEVNS